MSKKKKKEPSVMYIAAYGSLKAGFHNFERMGEQKLVGSTTIKGAMFMFTNYPYLFQCFGTIQDEHQAEIYEVNQNTFSRITMMELAAGYHLKTFEWQGKSVSMYIANNKPIEELAGMMPYYIKEYTLDLLERKFAKKD
jgi:gamma-glutamylcyclotransferase (GGCT)/AIG2-like uncharacterized protein YtfP